ncbi:TetR/AcrR family transcriptional regulator [Streptomyces sp. NPDC048277]|uniref:TetR/AcrR family transcriptional regulator n=1 Tax=Streptomyces sp. NPDC048277 TaxID=3155027 RepID=UPI0033CF0855
MPATQAERSDASRRTLVQTTIELLAREGYRAASIVRIQEASGLSRGLVGYHFGSKLKLMEAVVTEMRRVFVEETEGEDDARALTGAQRIVGFFDSYFTRLARNPDPARAMLVLAVESVANAPELRPRVREAYAGVREGLADRLRAGVADGSVRPNLDPDAHAAVLEGMLRGIVLEHFVDPDGFDLGAAHRAAVASLEHDLTVR